MKKTANKYVLVALRRLWPATTADILRSIHRTKPAVRSEDVSQALRSLHREGLIEHEMRLTVGGLVSTRKWEPVDKRGGSW